MKVVDWKCWKNSTPYNSVAMEISVVQGMICKALWDKAKEHESIIQWLIIHSKPRNIYAKKEFKANELKLVPSTLKIDAHPSISASVPRSAVDLGVILIGPDNKSGFRLWLSSHTFICEDDTNPTPKLVSPAFLVPYGSDDSDVNMRWDSDLSGCTVTNTDHLKIPLLVNTRAIKKGEKLFVKKPPDEKALAVEIEFETPAKKLRGT